MTSNAYPTKKDLKIFITLFPAKYKINVLDARIEGNPCLHAREENIIWTQLLIFEAIKLRTFDVPLAFCRYIIQIV